MLDELLDGINQDLEVSGWNQYPSTLDLDSTEVFQTKKSAIYPRKD